MRKEGRERELVRGTMPTIGIILNLLLLPCRCVNKLSSADGFKINYLYVGSRWSISSSGLSAEYCHQAYFTRGELLPLSSIHPSAVYSSSCLLAPSPICRKELNCRARLPLSPVSPFLTMGILFVLRILSPRLVILSSPRLEHHYSLLPRMSFIH